MAKERKDKHFIKKPIYEGGLRAMRQFISAQLQYPKEALKEKIEGTVYIKYTINHLGRVVATKVISSIGYGCDEEAERIVRLLLFKVAKTRGVKVTFHRNIQIHFRLPKQKRVQKTSIVYTYSKNKKEDQNEQPNNGYHYSVDI